MARYDDDDDDDDIDIRRGGGRGREPVPNYLTQAILTTLCCCLPFGIVAIVKATQVNKFLEEGHYGEAVKASEEAKKWCWISFGLGLVVNVVYGIVQVMAAVNQQGGFR